MVLFLVIRSSIFEKLFFAGSLLLFHKTGLWLQLESKGLRNKRLSSLPAKRLSFGACRVDAGKHCGCVSFSSCRLRERCQRPGSQAFCGLRSLEIRSSWEWMPEAHFPFLGSKGKDEHSCHICRSQVFKAQNHEPLHTVDNTGPSPHHTVCFIGEQLWAHYALGDTAGRWWGLSFPFPQEEAREAAKSTAVRHYQLN